MARSIHVRLDDSAEDALSILRNAGMSDSEAVRTALHESAARRRTKSAVRAEAARLAADPVDREEMRAVMELMEELAPESPLND
jgi:antitoxin component of RelBE/YafQ-DinJ toxin-antitoxin module